MFRHQFLDITETPQHTPINRRTNAPTSTQTHTHIYTHRDKHIQTQASKQTNTARGHIKERERANSSNDNI